MRREQPGRNGFASVSATMISVMAVATAVVIPVAGRDIQVIAVRHDLARMPVMVAARVVPMGSIARQSDRTVSRPVQAAVIRADSIPSDPVLSDPVFSNAVASDAVPSNTDTDTDPTAAVRVTSVLGMGVGRVGDACETDCHRWRSDPFGD